MKIAITGTIGSGKSTVSDYIRKKGYEVFDCDKVNANLLEKGNLGYVAVKYAFPDVFDGDNLNKSKLANIVFNSNSSKALLEDILHPLILSKMNRVSKNTDIFFAEVPLLFEKNWDKYFDVNILVSTNDEIALKRLVDRGLNLKDARNRLKNQYSNEDKALRANEIIYNNGSLDSLYKEIDTILEKYVG